jgi:FKBP-type peptidyl-prolyl cis-trans isomerase 2
MKTCGRRAWIVPLVLLAAFTTGCSVVRHSAVGNGDRADIAFTCRFPDGTVAASTAPDLAGNVSVPKSAAFLPVTVPGPVAVVARPALPEEAFPPNRTWSFEDEILARLSGEIVGWKSGERRTVTLTAARIPVEGSGGFQKLARIRRWPKESRMSRSDYTARRRMEPEVGQTYPVALGVQGVVEAVYDNAVVIRAYPKTGDEVATPFGRGVIRDAGDSFEIAIGPRPGTMIRTGPLVGRITDVDDTTFTIDYGHPFGGETLTCDVEVGSVVKNDVAGMRR